MAKRGRPAKAKNGTAKNATTKRVSRTKQEEPVVQNDVQLPGFHEVNKDEPEKKVRYTGSHQVCPRCGTNDTVAYKSMDVDQVSGIRVQYRRCRRGHCRNEFKATLEVK